MGLRKTVFLVLAILASFAPVRAGANIFACCLPDGSCEELLLTQCDDRNGAALVGPLCQDDPCNPKMAPVASFYSIVIMVFTLLAFAIYTLMRRSSRE